MTSLGSGSKWLGMRVGDRPLSEERDFVKGHDYRRLLDGVSLTSRYQTLMVNHPRYMLRLGLVTALLYLLMSYPLSLVARRLERGRK
jgi:hypothetical protein